MKPKIIDKTIPIFNYRFSLVIAKSVIQGVEKTNLVKYLIKNNDDRDFYKGAGGVFVCQSSHRIKAIILPYNAKIDTLVHECYHLLQDIKRNKGFEDEETEAYLMGYLTTFVNDEINKYRKKNKL